jgi:hypothetical protein
MKKIIVLLTLVALTTLVQAQKTYGTRNGKISFQAGNDDDVKADNNEVVCRLTDGGDLTFMVLIIGFKFKYAEMQKGFNEEYLQSNLFPRSEFKGKITNMASLNLTKDGVYKVSAKGKMTLHGVSKEITVPGSITVKGGKITLNAQFPLLMKDYKIDASAVTDKVTATVNCPLQ